MSRTKVRAIGCLCGLVSGSRWGQDDERNGMDGADIAPGDTATRQAIDA